MKPRVLVTSSHPGTAIDVLSGFASVDLVEGEGDVPAPELARRLKGCDAVVPILTDRITRQLLESCPQLKLVANVAVGYDNVDVGAVNDLGLLLTNTPGVLDETTADLAFGLLIACARRVCEGDRFIRTGKWENFGPDLMLGAEVNGKTLGIVGYGRIGKAVARRAQGFGMRILYTRSKAPLEIEREKPDQLGAFAVSLDELLGESDFVSLHCPLNASTRGLIGLRELSLMKPAAILINTARGAVVDEDALTQALTTGRIGGAGLDVFADEPHVPKALVELDQVVLTPHIGSASIETRGAMAMLAVKGLISAFSGVMPSNTVNAGNWERFQKKLQAPA